jgi:hypothetical protein
MADGAGGVRTVGAHRRCFHGRPRTGRGGGVSGFDVRARVGCASPGAHAIEASSEAFEAVAVTADETEHQAICEHFAAAYPQAAAYQPQATRQIPLVIPHSPVGLGRVNCRRARAGREGGALMMPPGW